MMKYFVAIALLFGVASSLMAHETHKSGSVSVPSLGPSAYQLVTFKMSTEKGQIGDPITLRFKDASGNVLFETDLGHKEQQLVKIELTTKLSDARSNEMITVFPELIIGDEVVVPEHPVHFPAGMFKNMRELKQSGVNLSGKGKN